MRTVWGPRIKDQKINVHLRAMDMTAVREYTYSLNKYKKIMYDKWQQNNISSFANRHDHKKFSDDQDSREHSWEILNIRRCFKLKYFTKEGRFSRML